MKTHIYKRPESVLVVIYTRSGKVLLLQRAGDSDFWQSVTGSMRWDETQPHETARREVREETGVADFSGLAGLGYTRRFPIPPKWRHRYTPDVQENLEHAFALELADDVAVTLNPKEHSAYRWLDVRGAAVQVWSWTNREAIERVAQKLTS